MKVVNAIWIVIVMMAVSSGTLFAQAEGAANASLGAEMSPVKYQMATYSLPKLDKENTEAMSKAVASKEGIVSAKPDFANNTFCFIFDSAKISSDTILDTLKTISPDVSMTKVEDAPADAVKAGCSKKCPHAAKCAKAQGQADPNAKTEGAPCAKMHGQVDANTQPEDAQGMKAEEQKMEKAEPAPEGEE